MLSRLLAIACAILLLPASALADAGSRIAALAPSALVLALDEDGNELVSQNADKPFECHMQMQTRRGIWNLENLDLSQLVADGAHEFLFVWAPLKMKGATGSPGNPMALY